MLMLATIAAALVLLLLLLPLLIIAGKPRAAGMRLRIPMRVRIRLALSGGDVGLMFFRRGRSSAHFVPAVASTTLATVTAAELTAGTDLSKAVTAIAGFETSLNRINTPVMAYVTELQSDGPQTFADASMTLIEDDGTGTDGDSTARVAAYTALDEGSAGYIVLAPSKAGALTTGDDVEIWPVKVGARNRGWSLDPETARYVVQFAVTGQPNKDATVGA